MHEEKREVARYGFWVLIEGKPILKRLPLPTFVGRTAAHFETSAKFLDPDNSIVVNTLSQTLESVGVPMTRVSENTVATTKDELHCFVIGETGCGKTRRIILPTIRLMSKAGESMVITDPKGELYKTTANALRDEGYIVQVLNFRNFSRGDRWNPFSLVERLYNESNPSVRDEFRDKAISMLKDFIEMLKHKEGDKDPYWDNSAGSILMGCARIILDYGKPGDLTFENMVSIARTLSEYYNKGGKSLDIIEGRRRWEAFLSNLPQGSPIRSSLSTLIVNAEDTRNCILSELEEMVSLYIDQSALLDMLSISDIDLDGLGLRKTALFVVLPDDKDTMYPIATVLISQIYSTLIQLADEQGDGKLPNKVTFILDEFANFARIPTIASMLTAARSRGVRFVLVCQSVDQLIQKYDHSGMEIILSNCRVWIYMKCRNLSFLKRLEEGLGTYISPYTGERYPLVEMSELQQFETGQVLVVNDRCAPIMGKLDDYDQYEFGTSKTSMAEFPYKKEATKRRSICLEDILINSLMKSARDDGSGQDESDISPTKESIEDFIARKKAELNSIADDGRQQPMCGNGATKFEAPETNDEGGSTDSSQDFFSWLVGDNDGNKTQDPLELFREGRIREAAVLCVNELEELSDIDAPHAVPTKNNLAFLIRYGKLNGQLRASFSLGIRNLLDDGVSFGDAYSTVNLALFEIGAKHYKKANALLCSISDSGWSSILEFWNADLWQKSKDSEGAFVTVLAHRYASENTFGPLEKAIAEAAERSYGDFLEYIQNLDDEGAGGGQEGDSPLSETSGGSSGGNSGYESSPDDSNGELRKTGDEDASVDALLESVLATLQATLGHDD